MRRLALAVWLFGMPTLLVLLGPMLESHLLRTRLTIHGHTEVSAPNEAFRGLVSFPARPTAGVLWHEMLHMEARLGRIARDVPTAAAFQFCLNARLGTVVDTAAHEIMQRVWRTASKGGLLRLRGDELLARMDALLRRDSIQVEKVPDTYRSAAMLAGLALTLTGSYVGCEDLVSFLMLGASARTSLRAVREPRVERWLRSLYFAEPYEMLDISYNILAERRDTALILEGFGILSARGARDSSGTVEFLRYLDVAWHRYADPDTLRVWQLGSRTRFRVTSRDTAMQYGGPLVWLNTRTIDGRVEEVPPHILSYVQDQIGFWFRWSRDVTRRHTVVGPANRNFLHESLIMLQFCPLIPVEAETVLLVEDGVILGALITINTHVTELGVIGQEIAHAAGLPGHVKPGEFESIMQNPLPRPHWSFENASYRHFLTGPDAPQADSTLHDRHTASSHESGLDVVRKYPLPASANSLTDDATHRIEGIAITGETPMGRFSPDDQEFIRATLMDERLMPRVLRRHLGSTIDSLRRTPPADSSTRAPF